MAVPMKFKEQFRKSYCFRLALTRLESTRSKEEIKQETGNKKTVKTEKLANDWIGPPDKVSNIRKFKYHIPDNETAEEKEFRLKKEETQEWHHQFWTQHNKNFFMLKDEFVKKKLEEKQAVHGELKGGEKNITAEEMSEFYKKFLDNNYVLHKEYNKEWYKRNIKLLWPAVKVKLKRMLSKNS